MQPVTHIMLHSYGASTKFPTALRYAGARYFGLSLDDLAIMQGAAQLRFYLGHVNQMDRTGKLLIIEKDILELVIGKGTCPLSEPGTSQEKYVDDTWIGSLSSFLHMISSKV